MAVQAGKKTRKPYTITKPREKWTADEHDLFLHALLLFGRDWKTIEQFVATKTATQVRSHAQKHFLMAHKLGLAAPPHPRRAAVLPQPPFYDDNAAAAPGQLRSSAASALPTRSSVSITSMVPFPSGAQQRVDWACASAGSCWPAHAHGSFMETPNCWRSEEKAFASPSEAWFADPSLRDETIHLPLSSDDPHFAQVYRFIGDVFGSGAPVLDEAQLQRLQRMEPVVAETILLMLRNLEANLSA